MLSLPPDSDYNGADVNIVVCFIFSLAVVMTVMASTMPMSFLMRSFGRL